MQTISEWQGKLGRKSFWKSSDYSTHVRFGDWQRPEFAFCNFAWFGPVVAPPSVLLWPECFLIRCKHFFSAFWLQFTFNFGFLLTTWLLLTTWQLLTQFSCGQFYCDQCHCFLLLSLSCTFWHQTPLVVFSFQKFNKLAWAVIPAAKSLEHLKPIFAKFSKSVSISFAFLILLFCILGCFLCCLLCFQEDLDAVNLMQLYLS